MLDAQTIDSLSLFGLIICVCYGYHLMGMAILKRGRTVDVALTTPLSTILAGAGVYMLMSVPMVYSGIPIAHTFGSFIFLALILLVTCRRGLAAIPEAKEMNRTLFLLLTAALFPTLAMISNDIQTSSSEWQYWMVPSLIQTPGHALPEAYDILPWQSAVLQHPPAWYIMPLFHDMAGRFKFEQFALTLNFTLCILALISMVRLCDLRVRWSNVSVVTGGLAFSFFALSPLISIKTLLSIQPDIIAGCALLAISAPLLKAGGLPFKGQAGLTAFAGALLALSAPDGIFYIVVLSIFWVMRSLKEPKMTRAGCLKSTVLILLVSGFGMSINRQFVSGVWPWEWHSFYTPSIEALTLIIIMGGLLLLWNIASLVRNIPKPSSLPLVTAYTCLWFGLFIAGLPLTESVLGFVILIPFWQFAVSAYSRSTYAKTTYNNPWGWGGAFIGITFVLQIFYLPYTQQSDIIKEDDIASVLSKAEAKNIAIWDKDNAHTYGSWIFMKSAGKTQYFNAREWATETPRKGFLPYLQQRKADYLLITAPDKTISKILKTALPQEHVFMLKIGTQKFALVSTSLKK